VLTSNRDEAPSRATARVVRQVLDGHALVFPQDPQSGGSWICISEQGRVVCVLNGAFELHVRKLPYRRSRGLVVLDVFEQTSLTEFFENYSFEGIEPFTMVAFDEGRLFEMRWDNEQQHLKELDTDQPYIWSSATLYNETFRNKRQALFEAWLKKKEPYILDNILAFHTSDGTGDEHNDFIMNRFDLVKTVSITSIERTREAFQFYHKDLTSGQLIETSIDIATAQSLA